MERPHPRPGQLRLAQQRDRLHQPVWRHLADSQPRIPQQALLGLRGGGLHRRGQHLDHQGLSQPAWRNVPPEIVLQRDSRRLRNRPAHGFHLLPVALRPRVQGPQPRTRTGAVAADTSQLEPRRDIPLLRGLSVLKKSTDYETARHLRPRRHPAQHHRRPRQRRQPCPREGRTPNPSPSGIPAIRRQRGQEAHRTRTPRGPAHRREGGVYARRLQAIL